MTLCSNKIHQGDCIRKLGEIDSGSVDIVFADPPFNIGYEYDVYDDQRSGKEYLDWCGKWMSAVWKALKPTGTFWLAIGDEYAAELKVLAQEKVGFRCRSWVIWYYTFGVNCVRGFSRSHTHLFHFVKDPDRFTFNDGNPAVRVLSARALVYADRRANTSGRLPDNTWILRPQDLPGTGFDPTHDTWYFARVAGTFKEREGFHGCQMPEQLLGRIVRISSNPQDLVVDPFAGSGTTLVAAKKLGRRWLGIDLSLEYVTRGTQRLDACHPGDPLDGPADPARSAPKTSQGKRKLRLRNGRPVPQLDEKTKRGIIDAYVASCHGHSTDLLLCDPELNEKFIATCKKSLAGDAYTWNRFMLRIRKQGKLPKSNGPRRHLGYEEMDPYSSASEVALQLLTLDYGMTIDEILCSPTAATEFDRIASEFTPGYTSFEYRWAALTIRKRAKRSKKLAREQFHCWLEKNLPRKRTLTDYIGDRYEQPGVYLLLDESQPMYVGETFNLRKQVERILDTPSWMDLGPRSMKFVPGAGQEMRHGLQSILIERTGAPLNWELLRPKDPVVA